MKTAKLEQIDPQGNCNKRVNRILAEIRALKPTEVVIWYSNAGENCGVRTSDLTDRTKVAGALTVAAMDVWNSG